MRIELAGPLDIDSIWPIFEDGIQRACEDCGGDLSAGYLHQQCRSGNAFLIIAHEDGKPLLASVWRYETWARDTVFRCLCLSGTEIAKWFPEARKFAADMARKGGAKRIIAEGRKGWERIDPEARVIRYVYEVKI